MGEGIQKKGASRTTIRTPSQARGAKARGYSSEVSVVDYFKVRGFLDAERCRTKGIKDTGDLGGIKKLVVSVKSSPAKLSSALNDLPGMIANADLARPHHFAHTGLVVTRRKGTSDAGSWYATMPLSRMIDLLVLAGWKP